MKNLITTIATIAIATITTVGIETIHHRMACIKVVKPKMLVTHIPTPSYRDSTSSMRIDPIDSMRYLSEVNNAELDVIRASLGYKVVESIDIAFKKGNMIISPIYS